jgi:hypothetical protein
MSEKEDGGGRQHAADLEQYEYGVVTVYGKRSDENAADEPHRPSTAADAGGAVLLGQVNDLR